MMLKRSLGYCSSNINWLRWGFDLQLMLLEIRHLSRLCTSWDGKKKKIESFLSYKSRMLMHLKCPVQSLGIWSTGRKYSQLSITRNTSQRQTSFSGRTPAESWSGKNLSWFRAVSLHIMINPDLEESSSLLVCGSLSWKAPVTNYLQKSRTEVLKTLTFSLCHLILVYSGIEGEVVFFIFFSLFCFPKFIVLSESYLKHLAFLSALISVLQFHKQRWLNFLVSQFA